MKEKNYTGLVPENVQGREIAANASSGFNNESEAHEFYAKAKERLLYINDWSKIADNISASFQLVNPYGAEATRNVQKGDYFKIDIPGPGNKSGDGYDWVIVDDVKEVKNEKVESIAVKVHPSKNPQKPAGAIAHFYDEQASSTFVITREGKKVSASIYDKNVEVNKEGNSVLDKIRNVFVGVGAKHGFSKIQWQTLADALVKKE